MPDERRRRRGDHEQQHLDLLDRDADVAGGVLLAADGEDPVAEARAREHPGGQERDADPPDHADAEVVGRPERAREDRRGALVPGDLDQARDAHRAGDDLGEAEVDALQDEERRERDDEARQLRLHHHEAVEEADAGGEGERDDDRRPHAEAPLGGQQAEQQAGRAGHHAGRQVELAADHQQRDDDGHDAQRRGDVGPVGDAAERAEAPRRGGEEQPDGQRADQRAQLRSAQQLRDEADLGQPVVDDADRRRRGRRLGHVRLGHQRSPLSANFWTWAAFSFVTRLGPVRTGWPPPIVLRLRL